jgi:hypothetical protein
MGHGWLFRAEAQGSRVGILVSVTTYDIVNLNILPPICMLVYSFRSSRVCALERALGAGYSLVW